MTTILALGLTHYIHTRGKVTTMAVENTLRRVDSDLAPADVNMALERLREQVGSFPARPNLR